MLYLSPEFVIYLVLQLMLYFLENEILFETENKYYQQQQIEVSHNTEVYKNVKYRYFAKRHRRLHSTQIQHAPLVQWQNACLPRKRSGSDSRAAHTFLSLHITHCTHYTSAAGLKTRRNATGSIWLIILEIVKIWLNTQYNPIQLERNKRPLHSIS
ncbi:Hypothetical_protein [Hexamita inflata]|uniref:Hypothetical_protein n=1 Tax=Hexamita inflata TaxID=28002 RepID=A0AA86UKM0_9EUKA|nr:Hypothetical protein HINF_LOCUS42826 [Hexamita inflata]